MSDLLDDPLLDDPLRDAFDQFRGEVLGALRPPGATATRHAVTRRQRVRGVATAAGVVAVIAGVWGVANLGPGSSTMPPVDVAALRQEALTRAGVAQERPEVWLAATTADPQEHTFGPGYPAGAYLLTVACAGQGWVTVTWQTTTGASGQGLVACNGGAVHDAIALAAAGQITVTVEGDARAAASAAQVALAVTDPRQVAATAALPTPPGQLVGASSGETSMGRQDTTGAIESGVYHLSFVCVGTGTVRVSLGVPDAPSGPDLTTNDLQCTEAGAPLELTFSNPAAVDLSVLVEGLPGGDAGYAYRLWRS